jgi:hypothetical protein
MKKAKLVLGIMLIMLLALSNGLIAANQVVTNNSDSGAGSLRQAIIDAGDGDEITFNLSAGNETITISSELGISESLTIDGSNTAGSGTAITVKVTSPGSSEWRVFNINASGKSIEISNLKAIGGSEIRGAVLYNGAGIVSLLKVTISDGNGTEDGNGIYNIGSLTLNYSTVSNNGSYSGGGIGAGIYNSGTLTLLNSTIADNETDQEPAGIYMNGGTAYIINTTITNNDCDGGGGGGGLQLNAGSVFLLNSLIINNTNGGDQSDIYTGGNTVNAYYCWYGEATGTIGGSNNNTSSYTSNDLSALAYNGGYTNTSAVASAGNASTKAGNGVRTGTYEDSGTKYAFWDGAGWKQLTNPATTAIGVTEITTDQRGYYRTSSAITRGAYQYNGIVAKIYITTSWTGGTIGTDVFTTIQAAIDNYPAIPPNLGIYLAETAILESGITIAKDVGIKGGGANTTIVQAAVTSGTATDRVFNITAGNVTLENMTVRYGNLTGSNYGAGISNTSSGTINISNISVESNNCGAAGGGIYSNSTGSIIITDCSISNNTAGADGGDDGGGIYFNNSSMSSTISNSTIYGNSTTNWGGGLTLVAGSHEVTNSTIYNNNQTAAKGGGGIAIWDGTTALNYVTIACNTAVGKGGGVYLEASSTLTVKNSIIADNNAASGSDYYYDSGTLTDNGYNIVEYQNLASMLPNNNKAFYKPTDILYNTRFNNFNTNLTSWSQDISDLANQNLNIATSLADNGGSTQTLAISSGSFAIGAGNWDATITTDQRGEDRAHYPAIGSYEFTSSLTFTNGNTYSPSSTLGQTDQAIGRFALSAAAIGGMLKETSIQLNGTRTGISNFKLWVSSDDTFGSDTQLSTTVTTDPGDGNTVDFSNFESDMALSAKYYFLTCDVAPDATGSVQAFLVDDSDLAFGGGNLSGSFSNAPLSNGSATLPVELSAFTAQFLENTPTLYWKTQSETDNMGWFVYRSEENNFTTSEKISEFIEGYGTTTLQQSYFYEDQIENPEVGDTYYYWLESIDYSGIINHYDKVAILTIPDNHGSTNNLIPKPERFGLLQNEPNPVVNSTRISFNLHETAQVDLAVYNLKGQLIKKLYSGITSKHTVMWNGKDEQGKGLENGVYFYKLNINGKTTETKKLILMK